MANAVYPNFKDALLTAASNVSLNVDTANDGPYVALIDTGTYTYGATHEFYNPSLSGIVGTPQRITSPTVGTVADGVFDGANVTYTAVSGATVEALVYYRHNAGADTTWRLFLYYDQSGGGLPVTPNGGDITVSFNASGIFLISDARQKENIEQIGNAYGLPLYRFNYIGRERREFGLIAQDIERLVPDAVREYAGVKMVDYGQALEGARLQ